MTPDAPLAAIADDLTGALDVACALATPRQPVRVSWQAATVPISKAVVVTTDSRDLPEQEAVRRVKSVAAALSAERLAFKKIDSVMRGHPVAETHVWFRKGPFDLLAVIPAFPRHHRLTRGAQQWVRYHKQEAWQPVGPNLCTAFECLGLKAVRSSPHSLVRSDAEAIVVDAENDADIVRAVEKILSWRQRVLWCGTGGLAGALGSYSPPLPVTIPSLILAGTTHPVTQAQLRTLATPAQRLDGEPLRQQPSGVLTVICADDEPRSPEVVRQATRAALTSLRDWSPPPALFVTGGQTLQLLCKALNADYLDCLGSLSPGLPVATLVGGAWHGVQVISKSGGFGHPELLLELAIARR